MAGFKQHLIALRKNAEKCVRMSIFNDDDALSIFSGCCKTPRDILQDTLDIPTVYEQ